MIPDHNRASPILTGWNDPLKIDIGNGMVLDLYRKAFFALLKRNAFRHGSGLQNIFYFEAEIIMWVRGDMFLDDEPSLA